MLGQNIKTINMVNIEMFRHPKYYKELRKRNKSDQAISLRAHDGERERATGPGLKLGEMDIASSKQQASKRQASSFKLQAGQATSYKLQAPWLKPQASSRKLQAPRFLTLEKFHAP